ncbi:hypothetical protein YDYSG_60700 [Paenibacillus tyrfis]|uniref:hypothetical protein n=1 Tax=Paenibacillus tyrfis TaxID=1501230 RepID=UPI002491A41A|nr:hypothetical protein [Paenibacillus tyrfis]GLI10037.1 hypothetical protein YDYSG_60700 [Paenibacillus tyrfis]
MLERKVDLPPARDNPLVQTMLLWMYAALLILSTKWVTQWDLDVGLVFFFTLLLPFFVMLKWPNQPAVLYIGLMVMLIGKWIYALTTDPLFGPDARGYFRQVTFYPQLDDFIRYATEHITTNWLNSSAYPVFGLMYMPFYKFLDLADPLVIITFNSFLLVLCCNMTYRLNDRFFSYELSEAGKRTYNAVMIIGLLASPALMYMSSVFGKDITCAFLGLLCTQLLLNRRYILFIIVLFYTTMLRDYSIVYILSFYFLFRRNFKAALLMLIGALGVVFWKVGPTGLLNSFMLTVFLFISPNPFKAFNWDMEFVMRTAEAVYMMISFGLSMIVFLRHKETRSFFAMCLILLFTFGCTLVLVGFVTVTERNLEYGVGTIGDNMVRKKVPVVPILYMMNAYTLAWLFRPKAVHSKKGEACHPRKGQISSLQRISEPAYGAVLDRSEASAQKLVARDRSAAGALGARNALLHAQTVDSEMRR